MRETAVILVLAALSLLLPVFRLPAPSGPHLVGTATFPAGDNGLVLQVWYPAAPGAAETVAPYRPPAPGIRNWLLRHVRTAAWQDAPLADAPSRLPILLLVSGWGGERWNNTALAQDLASHGYLVAASDPPRGVFAGVNIDQPFDLSSPDAYRRTRVVAAAKLAAQVAALRAALDRLQSMAADPTGPLFGRLDLGRVGAVGYSFGGATAAEAAVQDPRIHAAVNLDGLLFGEAFRVGVPKPYLEMSDDGPTPSDAERNSPDPAVQTLAFVYDQEIQRINTNMARFGGWFVIVSDARHSNFADRPLFLPFRRFTDAGPVDPTRAFRVIAGWVRGFFDHVFDGKKMPDAASEPGSRVQVWPSPPTLPKSNAEPIAMQATAPQ
jgi:hypothetical protein